MTTTRRTPGSLRLERTRAEVDAALATRLEASLDGAPEAIGEPIRYAVLAPGKRIRPLLVVESYRAAPGDGAGREGSVPPPLLDLAGAVELVHAYSLVHDDLPCMDDDRLRRGRPTVHVRFGVRRAILAGAALMPLAVEWVASAARGLGLPDEAGARLIRILTRAAGAGGMVGGQHLDLRAEGRALDRPELERIHLGKTARLIEASCLMGGVAAAGGETERRALSGFGRNLGLAFQVVDDILDVTGTASSMGKAGGRDAALGKATMPRILGVDGARGRARALVDAALEELGALERPEGLERLAGVVLERDR